MKFKGFTVLEILFALAVLALAITIVFFSFSKLNSRQALDKSAALAVSILDEARSLTFSNVGDSQYGVHFEDPRIILFKGSVYSSTDPLNVATELNSLVGLRNVVLAGGGTDVVFERLTGRTDQAGTLEVFLRASPDLFRTISISGTGVSGADI